MEWIDRLNDTIAYIEEHLTEHSNPFMASLLPQKWQEISMDGTLQKLIGMMDAPGVLGISTCNNAEAWRYYIAVSTSRDQDGPEEYIISAATWAMFSGAGTN